MHTLHDVRHQSTSPECQEWTPRGPLPYIQWVTESASTEFSSALCLFSAMFGCSENPKCCFLNLRLSCGRLGRGGFTTWSILERVRVFVCGLHSETVSQREKINETGVTGTSPSAFAHTHGCSHARTRAPRSHPQTHPRTYTICARSPFTHTQLRPTPLPCAHGLEYWCAL